MTKYGYARVSSRKQEVHGESLECQREQLLAAGCAEVVGEAYTGMTVERPAFSGLVERLKAGDTLCVTKLDRLSRSCSKGIDLISRLLERGVSVHVLNMGLIDDTPTGRLMVTMLLAFAQFERDMIVERTQEGLAKARQREGFHEGRPLKELPDLEVHMVAVESGQETVPEACRAMGIGKSTWYRRTRAMA